MKFDRQATEAAAAHTGWRPALPAECDQMRVDFDRLRKLIAFESLQALALCRRCGIQTPGVNP